MSTTSSSCGVEPSIAAALPATVGGDDEQLFQLHIDRVLLATYTHRGQWPPAYERWAASDAR